MSNNGYFHMTDPVVRVVGGMELLPSWWSRPYEYAWAEKFAWKLIADDYRATYRDVLSRG